MWNRPTLVVRSSMSQRTRHMSRKAFDMPKHRYRGRANHGLLMPKPQQTFLQPRRQAKGANPHGLWQIRNRLVQGDGVIRRVACQRRRRQQGSPLSIQFGHGRRDLHMLGRETTEVAGIRRGQGRSLCRREFEHALMRNNHRFQNLWKC